MLNILWFCFFLIATIAALFQWLWLGDTEIFSRMVNSMFQMAELSVSIMLVLFGTLTLWMGFLSVAERAGIVEKLGNYSLPYLSA